MQLRAGIPLTSELEQLARDPFYADITAFSAQFLQTHGRAMKGYGRLWGQDPFGLWSRRWEYPFAAQRAIEFGKDRSGPVRILDAGSGVTFFPYYLCQNLPQAQVSCCDSNPSYPPMFAAINSRTDHARVSFVEAALQNLPLRDGDLDGICCISVLEHTDNYGQILREFARVTRREGLLVLTFDLSLDGRFPLSRDQASRLLQTVAEYYCVDGVYLDQELARMDARDTILSTDNVKRTEPQLLPWRHPMAKAVHDLIKGHGWTGGFRSKSIFCLDARRR
jgi:SAM-dependent methyltransferase